MNAFRYWIEASTGLILKKKQRREVIGRNPWGVEPGGTSWVLVQEEHGDILSESRSQSGREAEVAEFGGEAAKGGGYPEEFWKSD